ncbi:hypothetical protein M1K46_19240 [Fictibacillus sp. WQ 8-8]|uniref:hypothetical protein n=1 Tax=Fictibacillus sp. WQ 8-8 TaxID=2938788 RepID=UPI00210ECB70|nr:hypothetical protein [Fictibacillus sp. WQ 8-8]MCQ6267766.1 hypothetical protein [Fictibacillus sp. WQ 8-8]
MKSKALIKPLLCLALIGTVATSPYKLNLHHDLTTPVHAEKAIKSITFVSNETNKGNQLKNIKSEKKDESLDKVRESIKAGLLQVNETSYSTSNSIKSLQNENATALAFDVKEVKKDKNLQNLIHDSLQQGKQIYIYGELSKGDFKKLAKIDELKIPTTVNGTTLYANFEKEKGPKKSKKTGVDPVDSNDNVSIIGYSLNKESLLQYTEMNVNSYDINGKPRANEDEVYMQEIIMQQADIVDKINKNTLQAHGLITKNQAAADSTRVQEKYGYTGSAYGAGNTLQGRVETDYYLYKANSPDGSSTFDYFSLKPMNQITEYNDGHSRKLKTDIDIPTSGDELQDWDPHGTKSTTSYSISFGFPWNLSWSASWSDEVKIEDISSRELDYARWVVTDGDLNHQDFRPGAAWASTGTQAYAGIQNWATFWYGPSDQYPIEAHNKITVSYDY